MKDYIKEYAQNILPLMPNVNHTPAIEYIKNLVEEVREDLLNEMMKECDKTENEGGRILIEKFK